MNTQTTFNMNETEINEISSTNPAAIALVFCVVALVIVLILGVLKPAEQSMLDENFYPQYGDSLYAPKNIFVTPGCDSITVAHDTDTLPVMQLNDRCYRIYNYSDSCIIYAWRKDTAIQISYGVPPRKIIYSK